MNKKRKKINFYFEQCSKRNIKEVFDMLLGTCCIVLGFHTGYNTEQSDDAIPP
ncbi:hypothetical protein [Candidatus Cetobacterium colombiensis]|uniref:Uncharacterized protein n=1 Tax=Candidatus Cetobacterium colombiensis TaxID=3073100 RepID=A0ABU4W7S5_9FUSO|nr:hypothetical protein [Candidatus Cetobacterium colombiensis]MDX8335582.1 hypothetical protein [Candidatus Cetobacterium colombiensis]